MPTIKQLPAATAVTANDLLPVSQNGLTRSTTVSTLLGNTQPAISLAQGTIVGRISAGLGGPEAVSVGTGLAVQSGSLIANGGDHVGLALSTSLLADDEVVINSAASPRRLPATQLRSLFSAGAGVQIDANGTISITSSQGTVSVPGPKGDTGAQGPTGQGFAFRGAWQPNVAYVAYDVVTNGGQTYLAAGAVSAAATFGVGAWTLLAAQGAVGPVGPTGANGAAGPTISATSSSIGAVKPGSGLSVASDGTLSIGNVSLSSIAQGSATIGQLLGWTGTAWVPTTPAQGVSYTGSTPITVAAGVISLAQSGANIGQVLTWNGATWVPQSPVAGSVQLGSATPLMNGVAGAGTAANASHEDHRHPTDTTRAPLSGPVFSGSITLPSWTTAARPASPTVGTEGFATDTNRRETYTTAGWVQYVRLSDIPAAAGQLIGGSGTAGTTNAVTIGSGLTLSGGVLSAAGASSTPVSVTGVSIDGASIPATGGSPYQMATADRVVDVNKPAGAATKILLPQSPTLWVEYTIIDGKGDAGTNNVTIAGGSGVTINGQPTFVMNANNDAIALRAVTATTWRVS